MSESLTANLILPNLEDLVGDIAEESIVSRTVYKDDKLRVTLFGFAPGESLTEHTSSFPAVLHFLQGEAAVTLGDESIAAQPGTWVHMPARLPHSIVATTTVKMLLLMLTS